MYKGLGLSKSKIGSANQKLQFSLVILVVFFGSVLLVVLYISLFQTLVYFASIISIICFGHAIMRLSACVTKKPKTLIVSEPPEWPVYTVLVPLFREAHMVEQLITALAGIDYPKNRLEVFLICEAIDPFTISMVRKFNREQFRLIIVPPGAPQTKPRALNYAMQSAKGEFVTIYDAEDVPAQNQLKTAILAFDKDPSLGAVQAPLDYINVNENWLTRQFSLEYAALFHVWLPFLVTAGLPFPLGGTSNHMRRSALDDVGGWDAFNVTEDADLSFRLAANGWTLGYINPPTSEEAVSGWKAWHYQRSRWMKGYMQTWLVHMRAPFAPGGRDGIKRFFILQLTIGLTLLNAFFHLPILLFLIGVLTFQLVMTSSIYVPEIYLYSLVFSYAAGITIGMVGAIRAGRPNLVMTALTMPFYWIALFPPTLRALWELGRKPFLWHKTDHGVMARSVQTESSEILPTYDALG